MKEFEFAPKLTRRQKITAVMVGGGLGLLLAAVNIVFRAFLDSYLFLSAPAFILGAIIILWIAYIR
ncbi:MAG: hypothetical protein OS112_01980 [Methanoregula sp.]|nr:MAG: hypothetical protein OS112_01980 [Methanoregula sp.]